MFGKVMKGVMVTERDWYCWLYKYPWNMIIHTIWEVGFHRSQWRILPLFMVKGESIMPRGTLHGESPLGECKVLCLHVIHVENRMSPGIPKKDFQPNHSFEDGSTVTPQGSSCKLFWNTNLDFPVTSFWKNNRFREWSNDHVFVHPSQTPEEKLEPPSLRDEMNSPLFFCRNQGLSGCIFGKAGVFGDSST